MRVIKADGDAILHTTIPDQCGIGFLSRFLAGGQVPVLVGRSAPSLAKRHIRAQYHFLTVVGAAGKIGSGQLVVFQ